MRTIVLLAGLVVLAACSGSKQEQPASPQDAAAPDSPWDVAAARGVDFRGVGNEPGWSVEIDEGEQVTMVTDYGADTVVTPAPAPETNAAGHTVYRIATDAHQLMLLIDDRACEDAPREAIGAAHPRSVLERCAQARFLPRQYS